MQNTGIVASTHISWHYDHKGPLSVTLDVRRCLSEEADELLMVTRGQWSVMVMIMVAGVAGGGLLQLYTTDG